MNCPVIVRVAMRAPERWRLEPGALADIDTLNQ